MPLQAFLDDSRADAYQRLVDRLLASARYGERWARHWMDVAHFAETHGNDQDRPRENAWPYRDYLVRSFNEDKPYTQFVSEQVAGDVLYPADPQATVALGFLAAGPWDESSLMCIVDDTVDLDAARHNGLVNGLTEGMTGSITKDEYHFTYTMQTAGVEKPQTGLYRHAMITVSGRAVPPSYVQPHSLDEAFSIIVKQSVLEFLSDLQSMGDEPVMILPETSDEK